MLAKKKMESVMKLAKKVKVFRYGTQSQYECLIGDHDESHFPETPIGFLAIYVGDGRQRFIVPAGFLSHPLFKMLLDKAYREYGFEQRNGLVVPCRVSTFQEVVSAVECCNGQFDIEKLVGELL